MEKPEREAQTFLAKAGLLHSGGSADFVQSLSHVGLFETPWTISHQAPLSMGFSRQEYWSELPFPSPGNLPYPGIKPTSPALQVDSLLLNHVWSLLLSVTRGKVLPFNKGSFPPKGRVWMFSQEKSTHPLQSTHLSSISIYLSSRTYPSFKKVKFHPNLMQISITWPKL